MKFNFEATAVGSLPLADPKIACQLIFETFDTIPFWPQLPKRSFLENMYAQYSERLPGMIIDEKNRAIHVDSSKARDDLQEVYERFLAADVEYFKVSEGYAAGFYEFLDLLKKPLKGVRYVKGHITGPVSFGLSVTDENRKSIIYDKELFEAVTKILSMKARWQIRKLKSLFPNVIIFVDEPYLVSIGSSYVNINIADVAGRLDEIIGAIKEEGALCGLHCCGNTDWSFFLGRGVDIVNFDAYNFMKEFALYTDEVKTFLANGGTIAWGIVPSSDAIDAETDKTIVGKLKAALKVLADKGIDKGAISSLITPSCGVGSMDELRAKKVLRLTRSAAEGMRA